MNSKEYSYILTSSTIYHACIWIDRLISVLEDRCDLPFRHGRVHQDLPQVSQQVLARGRGEAVLRVRQQPARLLRDVAVVRAGVPGRQRAPGHRHRRRVAADRAAERQPHQGRGGGGAARHVPRRRRAGAGGDRHLRAALVVQPILQGLLLQLAHRRQPLRVRPAQGMYGCSVANTNKYHSK